MEIRKLDDGSVELFGYVNISERKSKIISSKGIKFREEIRKGAWGGAIASNKDIKLLVNHSWDKIYDSTSENLRLYEDNIGARFNLRTKDETLIGYAEKKSLQVYHLLLNVTRKRKSMMVLYNLEA